MRPPDPYMVGKLGSRRVDRTRARLLSSRQAATVHRRARRSAGHVRVHVGGRRPDPEGAVRDFGTVNLVIGPHGAALANVVYCEPGTDVIMFPTCDGGGCPSAADAYFS